MVKNKEYKEDMSPIVTITTSTYNRKDLLPRAMNSVKNQTYTNFEYIIVNNGSTENLDDIVNEFMNNVEFPVLYIKKEYGGYHSGCNCGISNARGKFIISLSSDDELIPKALEIFIDAWKSIPKKDREKFWAVIGQCKDQFGKRIAKEFPININSLTPKKSRRIRDKLNGENVSFVRTDIRRKFIMPEPKEVSYVSENIVWQRAENIYKTLFINNIIRIYYTDTPDSLAHVVLKEKDIQNCKNSMWNACYYLNNWDYYKLGVYQYFRKIIVYKVYKYVLELKGVDVSFCENICGLKNKVFCILFSIPAYFCAKKMILNQKIID